MTDREALLKTIRENPDDDTPRLIYADHVEENDTSKADAARAAFIRIQIELARMSGGVECAKVHNPLVGYATFNPRCRCGPCSLKRREYMVSRSFIAWEWHGQEDVPPWMIGSNDWARGFPASCSGRWREWLEHSAILLRYPIRRVRLTTFPIDRLTNHRSGLRTVSADGYTFALGKCPTCDGRGTQSIHAAGGFGYRGPCTECNGGLNEWTCDKWPGLVFEMPLDNRVDRMDELLARFSRTGHLRAMPHDEHAQLHYASGIG